MIKPGAISGTRQEGCFQVPLRSWELLCLCHHPCGSFHDVRLWLLLEPMRLVMSALSGLRPQSICASGLSGLLISLDCAVMYTCMTELKPPRCFLLRGAMGLVHF